MRRFLAAAACLLLLTGATNERKLTDRQKALHALNRLGFGPRPGDVDAVLKQGVDVWIERQLHPERISDAAVEKRLQPMSTLRMSSADLVKKYYLPLQERRRQKGSSAAESTGKEMRARMPRDQRPEHVTGELMSQRILRAAESERQLNEVMVDFWFNHFNVLGTKGGVERFLVTSYERDVIRPHLWGRFEDLLLATAKSPAMLLYLDNARSIAAQENRRTAMRAAPMAMRQSGLNENYAREIMELHTIGVDGGYSQKDVTELARVLTGWSVDRENMTFVFRRQVHDVRGKTVLGIGLPANGGIEEGERMIRFLARHPSTSRRIARKLAQRLVADDPPKALVDRVAATFIDTGGDLRKTVRAVIESPEFWDARHYRVKVKTPFEYVVSVIRAADARIDNPLPIARGLRDAGETLYGSVPPTGYSDTADAWVNSGALMMRLNFALAFAANRSPGIDVDVSRLIAPEHAADERRSIDALASAIVGGDLSEETRQVIRSRLRERHAASEDPWDNTQLPVIAGLILGSPEFQRQ